MRPQPAVARDPPGQIASPRSRNSSLNCQPSKAARRCSAVGPAGAAGWAALEAVVEHAQGAGLLVLADYEAQALLPAVQALLSASWQAFQSAAPRAAAPAPVAAPATPTMRCQPCIETKFITCSSTNLFQ